MEKFIHNFRNIINEMNPYHVKNIENWMHDDDGEGYKFDNIFKGRWRIVLPIKNNSSDKFGPEYEIFYNLKQRGWEPIFRKYTVTTKNKNNEGKVEEKEEERTGIFLQKHKLSKKGMKQQPRIMSAGKVIAKEFGQNSEEMDFWNKNSAIYTEEDNFKDLINPSTYSIILSRHPIDVLRMSDFPAQGIKSCHSQGGSYFDCAQEEAKGQGLIAYLVRTEDLDEVVLDDDEIFEDQERDVEGITPRSRIRIRRYVTYDEEGEKELEIALPETAIYRKNYPGFYKTIRDFLFPFQKEILEKHKTKSWELKGGSYSDNSFHSILRKYLSGEDHEDEQQAQGRIDDNVQEEDAAERLDRQEREWNELVGNFNQEMKYFKLDAIFDDDDGWDLNVSVFLNLSFTFRGLEDIKEDIDNYYNNYSNPTRAFRGRMENIMYHYIIEPQDTEIRDINDIDILIRDFVYVTADLQVRYDTIQDVEADMRNLKSIETNVYKNMKHFIEREIRETIKKETQKSIDDYTILVDNFLQLENVKWSILPKDYTKMKKLSSFRNLDSKEIMTVGEEFIKINFDFSKQISESVEKFLLTSYHKFRNTGILNILFKNNFLENLSNAYIGFGFGSEQMPLLEEKNSKMKKFFEKIVNDYDYECKNVRIRFFRGDVNKTGLKNILKILYFIDNYYMTIYIRTLQQLNQQFQSSI